MPVAMKNRLNNLRLMLALFFLALVIPTIILINQALSQMKWEAFRQHQIMAEELSQRIDKQLSQLIADEEKRSFADYAFLNLAGDLNNNILQRSPLSTFPVQADLIRVLLTSSHKLHSLDGERCKCRLNVKKAG